MPRTSIFPDPANKPRGYSPGVCAGGLVFVSGQLPLDAAGKLVGGDDAGAQARQCFRNIEGVLKTASSGMANVVKITAFLTRLEDFPKYAGARLEAFPSDPPASSTVVVTALAVPGCLVEVEAVAVIE
jgi:enamine deaminase RidA (YjgF/YER057c/UK114 family)